MATQIDVEPQPGARFAGFNENERTVLQFALLGLASDIHQDAVAENIDRESLPQAGATFLQANLLAYELGDLAGEAHPSREAAELMASAIAEGDAPLAEKMALEAIAEDAGPMDDAHPYYPDGAE